MYRLISGIFLIFVYKLFCIDILWYIMYKESLRVLTADRSPNMADECSRSGVQLEFQGFQK
jgi:hypothetical protein